MFWARKKKRDEIPLERESYFPFFLDDVGLPNISSPYACMQYTNMVSGKGVVLLFACLSSTTKCLLCFSLTPLHLVLSITKGFRPALG